MSSVGAGRTEGAHRIRLMRPKRRLNILLRGIIARTCIFDKICFQSSSAESLGSEVVAKPATLMVTFDVSSIHAQTATAKTTVSFSLYTIRHFGR